MSATFTFQNIQSKETVNQRCLLVSGRCEASAGDDDHVEVAVEDEKGRAAFPKQNWPMCQGFFKALVILAPGHNVVRFAAGHDASATAEISVHYVPLLQTPPLHLAILVAKDSPLLIDCPPGKFGALSSAHSSLDAAISKFRTTAYMWQALTAEEMRTNGLGRRTFRLEEEWALDTLSAAQETMQTTAKIHLIRAEMTVAELRDADLAQQNPTGDNRDGLHAIFTEALLAHGAPFTQEAQPIVAGLILDAHYDAKAKLIRAHAALGAHDPHGLSLGIFGSHLTYAWPRFVEEIPDCLLDTRVPGDRVGNDSRECASMWEACAVGQGAFLHEVGHAFSAPHTSGIMARGYPKDWPKCFLAKTATIRQTNEAGVAPVTAATPNECRWDLQDLLRFRNLAHFRLPSDADLDDKPPSLELELEAASGGDAEEDEDEELARMVVRSESGIVRVLFNEAAEPSPSVASPRTTLQYTMAELEGRFDRQAPLTIEVYALNGKQRSLDAWRFFSSKDTIRIPGTGLRLRKTGAGSSDGDASDCHWTAMLAKRADDGAMARATKIDIRVGCALDGAIVYYKDGSRTPCGERHGGKTFGMGGHQAKKIALPEGVDIAKVAVTTVPHDDTLRGLRMVLANGKAMGALNRDDDGTVEVLTPTDGYRIIGFYGTSARHGLCKEFGIITAPAGKELPDAVYDYFEQQNQNDQDGQSRSSKSDSEDSDSDTSEDSDTGYDSDNGEI